MDKVTVICYGQTQEMERWEAIDYYSEGVMACDGSERERYETILLKLLAGLTECSDEIE